MSTTYNGNSASYPTSLTIPSDGDLDAAASVNAALEGLADRTAFLKAQGLKPVLTTFTASGTLALPADAKNFILYEMCGGGGGGGGGLNGLPVDQHGAGGGGGGGAILVFQTSPVVPGRVYNVFVGAGGVGAGATFSGGDGGDSSIQDSVTLATLVTAKGGAGGLAGKLCVSQGPDCVTWGMGGPPVITNNHVPAMESIKSVLIGATTVNICADAYRDYTPQRGGNGVTGNNGTYAQSGNCSPQGYFGGNAGAVNATSAANYRGGGAGGGGGAGPFGNGGNGGNGGAPNNTGAPGSGGNGTSASVNSGAGGGGGGSSGGTNLGAGAGAGGTGGNGGSGLVRVIYFVAGLP